jgi:hypothetical protein
MLSTQSLREQLDRYATGAISAEALEEWLVAESWDMRRWVSVGLQRFIEAMQAMFIQYSDGKIAADQLREYLLQRREQLHRAANVTKQLEADRASLDQAIQQARRSLSTTRAFTLPLEFSAA